MSSFESLGVRPEIISSLEEMGWHLPREVQDESIPLILGGGDVVISAPTGSGKTGALSIPTLQLIYERLRGEALSGDTSSLNDPSLGPASSSPWSLISALNAPLNRPSCPESVSLAASVTPQGPASWGMAQTLGGIPTSSPALIYVELTMEDFSIARVGYTRAGVGLLGLVKHSYGIGSTGKRSIGNTFEDAPGFAPGDTIGLLLNLSTGSLSISRNGGALEEVFKAGEIEPPQKDNPRTALHLALCFKGPGGAKVNGSGPFLCKSLPSRVMPLWSVTPSSSVHPTNEPRGGRQNRDKETENERGKKDNRMHPLAVVLEPTRELAIQFCGELRKFSSNLISPRIKIGLRCVGATSASANTADEAKCADPHVLVTTAATCSALLASGELSLSECDFFLLDEADGLLGPGSSRGSVLAAARKLPSRAQVVLCSATMLAGDPSAVSELCKRPQRVDLSSDSLVPDTVEQLTMRVEPAGNLSWVPQQWGSDSAVRLLMQEVFDSAVRAGWNGLTPATSNETTTEIDNTKSVCATTIPPNTEWVFRRVLRAFSTAKDKEEEGKTRSELIAYRPTLAWIREFTDGIHENLLSSQPPAKPEKLSGKALTAAVESWAYSLYSDTGKEKIEGEKEKHSGSRGRGKNVGLPASSTSSHTHSLSPIVLLARDLLSIGTKVLKLLALMALIDRLQPGQAMIFCRTRLECDAVSSLLKKRGLAATTLHSAVGGKGDRNDKNDKNDKNIPADDGRASAVAAFKQGAVRFLVCTDVGARGVDVRGLPLVLSLTLTDATAYIHRVGRTGRAGRPGFAIALLPSPFAPRTGNESHPIVQSHLQAQGQTRNLVWEKVWFHKCKNPASCRNTKELQDGGCSIWFAEQMILEEVQAELGGAIIPAFDADDLERGPECLSTKAKQGQAAGVGADKAEVETSKQHVAILKPFAQELYALELSAQKAYSNRHKASEAWRAKLQKSM